MKKWLLAATLLLIGANAFADDFTEGFPDPLGGWRTRWLAQNSDMRNYYVCYSGSGEDERGNNPCGLWICDGDGDPLNSSVEFVPSFGDDVTFFEIGIMAFVPETLTVYDKNGNVALSTAVTVDGTIPPCPNNVYSVALDGLSKFTLTAASGSQVEGNTSVDNVHVITGGGPVPTESMSWGKIKSRY